MTTSTLSRIGIPTDTWKVDPAPTAAIVIDVAAVKEA